jgi:hypothetical protein
VSTKCNTTHPHRTRRRPGYKAKLARADRYGQFRDGVRLTADRLNVARPAQPPPAS